MISHQIGAAFRDLGSLRFRSFLIILEVFITALCLGVTLDDSIQSTGNIAVAHSLSSSDVTYFSLFYDDSLPPATDRNLDLKLTKILDGTSSDYSIIKNNYFYDRDNITAPVIVALGGFAKAYKLKVAPTNEDEVVIGSKVTDYSVGDSVDFGPNQAVVVSRLPAGQAYLDPWMGYENLDDTVVLLSTYDRFSQSNPPDAWQQEVVGRTVLFKHSNQFVDNYVKDVSATKGLKVIPRPLDQRISTVYDVQLGKSAMFLMFFASLLVVMLITIVSSLNALIRSNLRRYAIERLYGAHKSHLILRMQIFLALIFGLPTAIVFLSLSSLEPAMQQFLPWALAAVLLGQALLSARAIHIIQSMSIAALLRKD